MSLPDLQQLGRYRDIALLLFRHGRADFVDTSGLEELLHEDDPPEVDSTSPAELARDLEELGPTFVKLGQLLSTRPDLLPPPYLQALARLQDDVEPFAADEVVETVERELGVRISKAFAEFERRPYAAASLAQVHRATLRDGTRVVVKVQRPGVRKQVAGDLEALSRMAGWLESHSDTARRYEVAAIQRRFEETLTDELDFRREAANLERLRGSLKDFPRVVVPRPIHDYSTSRVLTMTYVDGQKIDDLNPVVHTDLPGTALADELFRAYLHQVLVDGMFHADPHPGNVLLTHDHRIALIDLGMVGHVRSSHQAQLLQLLLALGERNGDRAAALTLDLSERREDCDPEEFRRVISDLVATEGHSELEKLRPGRLLMEVCAAAARNGVGLPPDLAVLAKTLLNLDRIGAALDPDFDPAAAIERASHDLMMRRIDDDASRGGLFAGLLEAKDFARHLPDRLNKISETLAENRLRVEVDAIDEERLVRSFEKIANRITAGVVLAALIIGAAMLMRIETNFTLFGYPGLAMTFFLLAAIGGLKLVWNVTRDS